MDVLALGEARSRKLGNEPSARVVDEDAVALAGLAHAPALRVDLEGDLHSIDFAPYEAPRSSNANVFFPIVTRLPVSSYVIDVVAAAVAIARRRFEEASIE